MGFLRVGDTFAYDPRTLHPLEYDWADERSVDEVSGFSVRLASQSGQHELEETDIRVTRPMTLQLAGSVARMDRIMGCLVDAGVWVTDGTGYRLLNDTAYLHLQTKDEVDRQRARGRDESNLALTVPAKLRDGDQCRYCKRDVDWNDRKSLAGATWEHLDITIQPTPLHLFVVCCYGCNRAPLDRSPLQPPPAQPKYSATTKAFIKKHLGRWPAPAKVIELYPGLRTWPVELAADGLRTTTQENAAQDIAQRPEDASESASTSTRPKTRSKPPRRGSTQDPPRFTDTGSRKSGFPGSGRVEKGLGGPGSGVSGGDGSGRTPGAAKRSKRGKGSRGPS